MTVAFEDLKAFVMVVRLGSMRRAADHLSFAPSVISRQIARLEAHYGRALLERRPDGILLTAAGQIVLDRADQLLHGLADLDAQLSACDRDLRGRVRVHAVEGVTRSFLAPLIGAFHRDNPEVRVELTVEGRKLVLRAVDDYESEIGFVYDHFSNPNVQPVASWKQPLLAFVRAGHPLLAGPATIEALTATRCAVPDEAFAIRRLVEVAYQARQRTLAPVLVANHLQSLIHAVLESDLLTFMPLQAARVEVERGLLVPIATGMREFDYRFISVVVHKARPRAPEAEAFLAAIKAAIPLAEAADRALMQRIAPGTVAPG